MKYNLILEGPDEVGKTTLKNYIDTDYPDCIFKVQDRCWLTNSVYRLAIPEHDWSAYEHEAPKKLNASLVVILPDMSKVDTLKITADHGYSETDYYNVCFVYKNMARMLWHMPLRTGKSLFDSVTILKWHCGKLGYWPNLIQAPTIAGDFVIRTSKEIN